MQSQPAKPDAACIGVDRINVTGSEPDVAEFEGIEDDLSDDDDPSSGHWEAHSGRPPGAEVARRARARIACDLLLARLYKYHPDHALAHLKGIEPHVFDVDVPMAPDIRPAQEDEKTAEQLHGTPDISLILQKVANF